MRFDPTINLGTVLVGLSVIGAVLGCYVRLRVDLAELRTMVAPMWEHFTEKRK